MNIPLAIAKLQEINELDEHGRYGRLAREAIEALKPAQIPWDAYHNRSYEPVETRAKEIYDFFEYKGSDTKPPWVPGGNSDMQDEARVCARRQIREAALSGRPLSNGDGK
jgi:hypothetical protein